jgi:hypothetical protein
MQQKKNYLHSQVESSKFTNNYWRNTKMATPTGTVSASTLPDVVSNAASAGAYFGQATTDLIGFYETSGGVAQQTVTGSKAGNAALTSLIAALVAMNLVKDSST